MFRYSSLKQAVGVFGGLGLWYAAFTKRTREIAYCNGQDEFQSKTVLITGAAGDIGHATAQAFARRGAKLALIDLPIAQAKMEKNGEVLLKDGASSVLIVTADMTKPTEVQEMVDKVVTEYGRIDCFFNNAGIQGELKPIHEQSIDKFQQTLNVNTFGVFLGMKYVSLAMIKSKTGGVIVNTSSVTGKVGPPNMAAYSASKFGVLGLTRTGAQDLSRYNIRVCAIAPGLLEGGMWKTQVKGRVLARKKITGETSVVTDEDIKSQEDRMIGTVPMGRLGKLSEVAEVVVFLCSDSASYVSGEVIMIDGGKTA